MDRIHPTPSIGYHSSPVNISEFTEECTSTETPITFGVRGSNNQIPQNPTFAFVDSIDFHFFVRWQVLEHDWPT